MTQQTTDQPGDGTTTQARRPHRRRWWILGGLAVVVAVALALPWAYANIFAPEAEAELAVSAPADDAAADEAPADDADPDADTGSDAGAAGDAAPATLDGTWSTVDGTEAGYRVDEVLYGDNVTVVGRTDDVAGEVTVQDGAVTAGEVTVQMADVTTDNGSRDGQFRGSIMDVETYPTSSFTLTEPVAVDDLADGEEITVTAAGEMTLRDTTVPVEAELTVRQDGDVVQVAGSVPVTFADFGITPPDLGFVLVEDEGVVEFLLVMNPA